LRKKGNKIMSLQKVAIVTGAARGIGKAIAKRLMMEGIAVVMVDISEEVFEAFKEMQETNKQFNGFALQADVSKKSDVEKMVKVLIEKLKKIDILVNNAGVLIEKLVIDLKEEDWDVLMNVNAKGVFLCCQAVARHMIKRKNGKIVNISSQLGKAGATYSAAYAASKAAVIRFTQVLALELAPYNINVNAVCPGATDTEMIRKSALSLGISPEAYKQQLILDIPFRRMATPRDIANTVNFLVSGDSDYMTAQAINITGGRVWW